jgi:F0F1-type ATP synthase assembly protein I
MRHFFRRGIAMGLATSAVQTGAAVAHHAPVIIMAPFIAAAMIFALIGIIAFSAHARTTGMMFIFLGFLMGGGAFFIMYKSESAKPRI